MTNLKQLFSERLLSIDIMRGLTLVLMLFVNDLYTPGVPQWMVHTKANFDGMGLADWVFPGFLFMVGMAIPFAIANRRKKGASNIQIIKHVLVRTISLLAIGVLMINSKRINAELSGIDKNLWAVLMYVSVFLIWNNYPRSEKWKNLHLGLKLLGFAGIAALMFSYKSGTPEAPTWLVTGWWGILGLIGWGYFAASLTYIFIGENIGKTTAIWLLFLGLNILSNLGLLDFFDPISPVLGVIINGNVPFTVVTGLLVSLLLRLYHTKANLKAVGIIFVFGMAAILLGVFLRQWFIISKIKGTPSWALICSGISMLVFVGLFYLCDIKKWVKWANFLKPAGQNSLTTYLAPDIFYYTIWGLALPILFYKQDENQLLAVAGSIVWALSMVGLTALLAKLKIRLKL